MSDIERLGLGRIIETEQQRDAVHIAVVPMTVVVPGDSYYGIQPGCKVKLFPGTRDSVIAVDSDYSSEESIGVIDPFLSGLSWGGIKHGMKVWVYLNPGSVVGLRHAYRHPLLDADGPEMNTHERWIRQWATQYNFDYDHLIATASASNSDFYSDYIIARGVDLHGKPDQYDEFWSHLEALKETAYPEEHREKVCWSCSC